ncbi:hypothetical protein [Chromatocurvus halotolerans]|uniref:Uncharacterized protein n=1 Tax=Chromatocurvus halotolerans TaxID=1132028 RepID=A0A4R2KZY5_9GAMM|nr:hypothetical protein [Chromatocurvus halotolerans]TCO78497.1 hypothetical protein EV688_101314 [Chromatocurvus halotolerans]
MSEPSMIPVYPSSPAGATSRPDVTHPCAGLLPLSHPGRKLGRLTATLLLCVSGIASFHAPQSAAEDFPGLERLMTVEQFRRTGLQKLSDTELGALNEWLIEYTAGNAQIMQGTSEAVREAEKNLEIKSRISGDFNGWDGDTIFRLENGQIWQQRLAGRYPYRGPENPEIRISKNFLGFYKMTVLESGKSVGVKRLR